jgi:hypothetical protein
MSARWYHGALSVLVSSLPRRSHRERIGNFRLVYSGSGLQMGLKRTVFRGSNAILRKFNLELQVLNQDFDARLDQPSHVSRIFSEFEKIAGPWLRQQKLFPVACEFDLSLALRPFYEQFLDSPFREKGGGSRFNNLAWLYLIAKAMKPRFVVDSGTFRGASAWAFSIAGVKVYSFDIDLSQLAYRAKSATYTQCDWTAFDWSGVDFSDAFIYFDDHLDQVRRLIEASQRAIPLAIFDDDFPFTSVPPMAHNGNALPKIEFVLDDELRNFQDISWLDRGRRYVFPIDHSYLARARSLIAATERLPDTSMITGIQQTPYRLVRIATGN